MRLVPIAVLLWLLLAVPGQATSLKAHEVVAQTREFSLLLPATWHVNQTTKPGGNTMLMAYAAADPLLVCTVMATPRQKSVAKADAAGARPVKVGTLSGVRYEIKEGESLHLLHYVLHGSKRSYTLTFSSPNDRFGGNVRMFDAIARSFKVL
jgi:hypothetical protein